MGIFYQGLERIVGYQTSEPEGINHPIDMNWKSRRATRKQQSRKTSSTMAGRNGLEGDLRILVKGNA
jgi:hypothetical protein